MYDTVTYRYICKKYMIPHGLITIQICKLILFDMSNYSLLKRSLVAQRLSKSLSLCINSIDRK